MRADIVVDFTAPDSEKWPDNSKFDIADSARCNIANRRQATHSRTPKKIDQKRLDDVVGMMTQKNRVAMTAFGRLRKKIT